MNRNPDTGILQEQTLLFFITRDDPDFDGREVSQCELELTPGLAVRGDVGDLLLGKPTLGVFQDSQQRDLSRERGVTEGRHGECIALLGGSLHFLLGPLRGFLGLLLARG
jgi:hypothetical protein